MRPNRDIRLAAVEWRDLVSMSTAEKMREVTLPLPWLALSVWLYAVGFWWAASVGSFFFFLTGLRQSHNAQHYAIGISRFPQDLILFGLSLLMLTSMHAVQATHLHHHRHCLGNEDVEGRAAKMTGFRAVLFGPLFVVLLHGHGWQLASPTKRRWIAFEILCAFLWLVLVWGVLDIAALRWHTAAMLVGECLTGFFAVWTVHHDCDPQEHLARTQRGTLSNWIFYNMFYHVEHHWFPAVPTCHLPALAERLDRAAPELTAMRVLPTSSRSDSARTNTRGRELTARHSCEASSLSSNGERTSNEKGFETPL